MEDIKHNRYIAPDDRIFFCDDETDFYYHRGNDTVEKLPREHSLFLQYCDELRTLEEHARFIYGRISGTIEIREIFQHLVRFAEKDILVSADSVIKHIQSRKWTSNSEPVSCLGWVTNCRLPELFISIDSFVARNKALGKNPTYIVCDDSANRNKVLRYLSEKSGEHGIHINYFGLEEKKQYIKKMSDDLKKQGIRKEIIEFALINPFHQVNTCGANRNSLMLITAGRKIINIDDDILYQTFTPSRTTDEVELTSSKETIGLVYYPDRKTLLKNISPSETDILESHGTILGKSVSEIVSLYPDKNTILHHANRDFISSLISHNGHIKATMPGIAGSSGLGTPKALLWVSGQRRDEVMKNEKHYLACIAANDVFRVPGHIKISNGTLLMGYTMGLDNREMLPPFFPIGRGSDAVFGAFIKKIMQHDFIGYLPFAMYHDPDKRKTLTRENLFDLSIQVAEIILFISRSLPVSAFYDNPEDRLDLLGKYYRKISELPSDDFITFLKKEIISYYSGYIQFLESFLRQYKGTPAYWADDIYRSIDTVEEILKNKEFVFPSDLTCTVNIKNKEEMLKKILAVLGELLVSWNLIYSTAKSYNRNGMDFFSKE